MSTVYYPRTVYVQPDRFETVYVDGERVKLRCYAYNMAEEWAECWTADETRRVRLHGKIEIGYDYKAAREAARIIALHAPAEPEPVKWPWWHPAHLITSGTIMACGYAIRKLVLG